MAGGGPPQVSTASLTSLLCPSVKVTQEQLETERNLLQFERSIAHVSRRGFLAAFAGVAAASALTGTSAFAQTATPPPMADVLNFALNLEYLEANFYLYATTGDGLSSTENGSGVTPANPPLGIPFDANTLAVLKALAQDETNHVILLRSAITSLGGTPIAQPAIDFGAMGAITTQAQFLAATRQFTALGTSAYTGTAQLLVSNPGVLTTAAQILGAEGQHAGLVSNLCIVQNIFSPAIDAQDVPLSSSNDFIVAAGTALSPARTPSQVLGVAYGVSTETMTTPPTGTAMGGFFPQGFNGNIKST